MSPPSQINPNHSALIGLKTIGKILFFSDMQIFDSLSQTYNELKLGGYNLKVTLSISKMINLKH